MFVPLAQVSSETLMAVVIFTGISLPIGVVMGYLSAYRYKRQYLRVAAELANMRGQNFRGQVSTLGMPQGVATGHSSVPAAPRPPAADSEEMQRVRRELTELTGEREGLLVELEQARQRGDQLQQQYDQLRTERDAETADTVPSPSLSGTTGTEAWQLAQLHREQIAMQIKLDDLLAQTAQLTCERDAYAARVTELEETANQWNMRQ